MLFIGGNNLGAVTGSLPKIVGEIGASMLWVDASGSSTSALYTTSTTLKNTYNNKDTNGVRVTKIYFDASRTSARYSRSDDRIIPDGVALHAIIKY